MATEINPECLQIFLPYVQFFFFPLLVASESEHRHLARVHSSLTGLLYLSLAFDEL